MRFVCRSCRSSTGGSLNVAGSSTLLHLTEEKFAAQQHFSGCLFQWQRGDEVGGRSLFLQVATFAPSAVLPLKSLLGFLYLDFETGQPRREDLCLMRFLLCLGASGALLSSSGGLITVFLSRRAFFPDSHLKQIQAYLIRQHCSDELI